jgi:Xaa-Pro aminopeptidase
MQKTFMIENIDKHEEAQKIAKNTITYIKTFLRKGVTEKEIANAANQFMLEQGADESFPYYGVGTLVLVGKRTPVSVSGKVYQPTGQAIEEEDLVTIDVTPSVKGYWGDFARSIVIAHGNPQYLPQQGDSDNVTAMFSGIDFERKLHYKLLQTATPDMTFHELHSVMNKMVQEGGYENIDLHGNYGHSIVDELDKRVFMEPGNETPLGEVGIFTFEPHIRQKDGGSYKHGFKKEDIYFFSEHKLKRM